MIGWPQLARQQAAWGARPLTDIWAMGGWMAAAPAPTTQKACPQPGLITRGPLLHTARRPLPPASSHQDVLIVLPKALSSSSHLLLASQPAPQVLGLPHELVQLQGPLQLPVPVGQPTVPPKLVAHTSEGSGPSQSGWPQGGGYSCFLPKLEAGDSGRSKHKKAGVGQVRV